MKKYKAMVSKSKQEVIFQISITDDEKEKIQSLEIQIIDKLIFWSNETNNYQTAISVVEDLLRLLISHFPEEAEMIRSTAESAGEKFLKIVDSAKVKVLLSSKRNGGFFLSPDKIINGKNLFKK